MSDRVARSNDDSEGAHESAARAVIDGVERRGIPGVEELHLFGSTVRGEASGISSDVDFLAVVADDVDRAVIEDQLRDVAYDVMLDTAPSWKSTSSPVPSSNAVGGRTIRSFGASSARGRRMSEPGSAHEQIQLSKQALDDAVGADEASLSTAVIVNRCYYSCFHATQAVYDRGYEPESHGGVLSLFGTEVVVEGNAPRQHGRFLNDLSALRVQADYGGEPVDVDIDSLIERTGTFVEDAIQLVDAED